MADRLIGVRAKIERANSHIKNLIPAVQAFGDAHRNCIRIEDDPQTCQEIYRIDLKAPPSVGDIPLIIGDAAHNLRSSLDHLAWQLVEASPNGKPDNDTAYPIYSVPNEFVANLPRKVKGISAGAQQIIEATQPYPGRNDALRKLSKLDNWDKHRLLIVTAIRMLIFGAGIIVPPNVYNEPMLQNGDELCRVPYANKENANLNFPFDVAFRKPKVVRGEPVVPLLTQLSQFVEGMVNQFIPFL